MGRGGKEAKLPRNFYLALVLIGYGLTFLNQLRNGRYLKVHVGVPSCLSVLFDSMQESNSNLYIIPATDLLQVASSVGCSNVLHTMHHSICLYKRSISSSEIPCSQTTSTPVARCSSILQLRKQQCHSHPPRTNKGHSALRKSMQNSPCNGMNRRFPALFWSQEKDDCRNSICHPRPVSREIPHLRRRRKDSKRGDSLVGVLQAEKVISLTSIRTLLGCDVALVEFRNERPVFGVIGPAASVCPTWHSDYYGRRWWSRPFAWTWFRGV